MSPNLDDEGFAMRRNLYIASETPTLGSGGEQTQHYQFTWHTIPQPDDMYKLHTSFSYLDKMVFIWYAQTGLASLTYAGIRVQGHLVAGQMWNDVDTKPDDGSDPASFPMGCLPAGNMRSQPHWESERVLGLRYRNSNP